LRPIAVVAAKIVAAMSFALPSIALVATAAGVTENVSLDALLRRLRGRLERSQRGLLPASAVPVLAAWTVGTGMLAALAWRRAVTR
jgi:hypothetical protein